MRRFIILILLASTVSAIAAESRRLVDFRGRWKFEIGDNMDWAKADFDDSGWDEIFVPAFWEDEGFPSYDGYAWYRLRFNLDKEFDGNTLLMRLGFIDDVDQVFLNGKQVGGSGFFPPDFATAYNQFREYHIPRVYFKEGEENVLAIRVYDDQLHGGITGNQVGIYERISGMELSIELSGSWKFKLGDEENWSKTDVNDSEWEDIIVPGNWEQQGYFEYNGYAWYRTTFFMPWELKDENLVLMLGKIDDFDETFLNGERVGKTGWPNHPDRNLDQFWQEVRAYHIPSELLKPGEENTISIRVYDGFQGGGIFEGPIGLAKRDIYREWEKQQKRQRRGNFLDWLFNEREREAKQEEGARSLWKWLTGDEEK